MYYDKRIRYLSYYESDIKLQNAGYVKFQVRDSLCQMIIHVKGPRLMGNKEAAVYLLSRGQGQKDGDSFYSGARDSRLQKHLLGNLSIRGGQGHCAVRMNTENMADSGLRYDEICGIKIVLHEYQYLESCWSCGNTGTGYKLRRTQEDGRAMPQEVGGCPDDRPVEVSLIVTPVSEGARVEKIMKGETVKESSEIEVSAGNGEEIPKAEKGDFDILDNKENAEEQEKIMIIAEESADDASDEETSMQEMLEREIRKANEAAQAEQTESLIIEGMEETEEAGEAEKEIKIQPLEEELQPDKWEQLKKTYPVVHPIREEEEYLKISPKDFVIFTEKYQELVHNSFLLHGYYNYKHLILGKKEKDGKGVYYLGVPGTFHDREKSVAVMFGFEAFDGRREPAEKGDFGYYLKRVEI